MPAGDVRVRTLHLATVNFPSHQPNWRVHQTYPLRLSLQFFLLVVAEDEADGFCRSGRVLHVYNHNLFCTLASLCRAAAGFLQGAKP